MGTDASTAPYLEFQTVRKEYGSVIALDGLSLGVPRGALVAILGPSGCGKTTALNLIAGFLPITSGSIMLDGRDLTNVPVNRRDALMVFQSYALFPHMTVFENVAYGLRARKVPKAERATRVQEVLDLVGLPKMADRFPRQLSAGQQQRIALGRAIAPRPKVLLLDEPLSNLDAQLRRDLRGEIRRVQQALGITTIFVTHDQEEALSVADMVVVLRDGRLEQAGPPADLYEHPQTLFTANFIGRSNLLPGEVVQQEGDTVVVDAIGGPLRAHVEPGATYATGQVVSLSIRPTRVRVGPSEAGNNQAQARLTSIERIGDFLRLVLTAGDGTKVEAERIIGRGFQLPAIGDTVSVSFHVEDTCVIAGTEY